MFPHAPTGKLSFREKSFSGMSLPRQVSKSVIWILWVSGLTKANLHSSAPDSVKWSSWSSCSRECDGGVISSNATCTTDTVCPEDGAVKYKTCNSFPCHQKDVPARDFQCAQYNQNSKHQSEEWLSFYNSNDPCRLYCRKFGSATIVRHDNVIDGTRCLKDDRGICINGHCWITDCTAKQANTETYQFNDCVVCGENGTQCGRYMWNMGQLSPCSVTCGAGTSVASVTCRDSLLGVDVDDSMCNENYRPNATRKLCKRRKCNARWVRGIWSMCSQTCGTGIVVRDVYCAYEYHNGSLKKVHDERCERKRPKSVAPCVKEPCPYWQIGAWSRCSTACGVGVQNRQVQCIGQTSSEQYFCSHMEAPSIAEPCYGSCDNSSISEGMDTDDIHHDELSDLGRAYSKPRWKLLFQGPCSASCGRGIRALTFQCQSYDYNKRAIIVLPDLKCLGTSARPPELEECSLSTCYRPDSAPRRYVPPDPITYLWRYTGYGPCSASCLGGTKRATVECVRDSDRNTVSQILCDPTSQPKDLIVSCNTISCPPEWRMGNWTACSASCGRGIETRTVDCIQRYGRKESQEITHPPFRCTSIPPVKTKFCGTFDCPPKWYSGEWSRCTPLCGGLRMRQVECRMRNSNGSMVTLHGKNQLLCTDTRPDAWQPCAEENCNAKVIPKEHKTQSLSEIKVDGSHYFQTKKNVNVKLIVGGVSTIIPGTKLSITCPVRDARRHKVTWSKVGKGRIFGVGRIRTTKKGSLTINRARPTDAGVYICQAGNIEANWTLQFHSANEGGNLFSHRKKYLNRRAEQKTEIDYQSTDGKLLLSDDGHNERGNESVTPYDFVVTSWSACSVTCDGKGTMTRSVTCEVIMEEYYKVVEDKLCITYGLKKPETEKMCEAGECPYWKVSHWNLQCVHKCQRENFGTQFRERVCRFRNGTQLTSENCPQDDSPQTNRACENKMCRATWKISTYSKCSKSCGGKGVRTRMLRCVWKGDNKSAGRLCANLPRPSLIRRCYAPPCSENCKDSSSYCALTKRLKLCRHTAYKKLCCATCSGDS